MNHHPYDHSYWDNLPSLLWCAYLNAEEDHRAWLTAARSAQGELSDSFWAKEYPDEVRQIAVDKQRELKESAENLRIRIVEAARQASELPQDEKELREVFTDQLLVTRHMDASKETARFRRLQTFSEGGNEPHGGSDKLDIETARNRPIADFIASPVRWSGRNLVALCPFHDERTPSFTIFPDNRYRCFSCQRYGDSITFYRELYGVSFSEAVCELGGQR